MKFFRRFSFLNPRAQGLLWGVLCACCVLGLAQVNLLGGLERSALDALFKARGVRFPNPQIAVVVVDDDAVARYGSWPLQRRYYTQLVQRLTRDGARTIAFDILFATPSSHPQEDVAFARACGQSGRVIQAAAFYVPLSLGATDMRWPELSVRPNKRFRIGAEAGRARPATGGFGPQKVLQESAVALGHVNVYPELGNGALRRIPHLIRFRGNSLFPSLALVTAAHSMGLAPGQIGFQNGAVQLGKQAIPLDEEGEILTNWIGGYGSFNQYSLNQVLAENTREALPPGTFKDRVVIIGSTATGAYEQRATPFSPLQPAVELQANALDDILSQRLLLEIAARWQWLLLLALCCGVGACSAGRNARFTLLVAAAGLLLVWIAALWLFRANWYWPIGAPILGTMLTAACCVAYQQLSDARRLKIAEERYALAVRGANDGIWDWNLETDAVYYSARWKAILGAENGEISAAPDAWLSRVHVADSELVRRHLDEHLSGQSAQFRCEFRLRHRDETYRWVLARALAVRNETGTPTRIAGSLTDITDRRHIEDQLLQKVLSDELTGLPNRTLFMDRLQRSIACSRRREDYAFAVLFLDLDRFKVINDSLGHLVGDEMLQVVARRLETCLRPGDTVARMGGDEFTMLIDDIADANAAIHVAERVQNALQQPLQLGGHDYASQASIGIAVATSLSEINADGTSTWRPRYEQAEDVLRDADTAMYRAKGAGRSRHVVFDEAMHTHALAQLRLETELRRAIERENFQVFYQPIVELDTAQLSGFEALVRWNDAERGLVQPSEFIAFAEETGLIIALDQWVLAQACRQIKQWQERFDRPDLTISVNLSGRQFSQSGLVKTLAGIVAATHLAPECLRLEITEGVVMQNAEASAQTLGELKALGFHLSIDDFGTGYSSLSYLHQFPLDVLKVDRSFVARLGANGENAEIVETIVALARSLDMKVVAEGVESAVHLAQLQRIGCDCAQGYLFARPLSAEAATALLQDGAWLSNATAISD